MQQDQPTTQAIRVAWISSRKTWKDFSALLGPLAIGLSDGMISVLGVCCKGEDPKILPSPPITFIEYECRKLIGVSKKELQRLADELTKRKIQLIHGLDLASADVACALSELTDLDYLLSLYVSCDVSVLRKLSALPSGIITSSCELAESLSRHFSFKKDATFPIPPGILQVSRPGCFSQQDKSTVIVIGANLRDHGGCEKLLKALADSRKNGKDIAVFVVAENTTDWKVRHKAMELGLNDTLTFVDLRDGRQMQGIFKSADLYIFMEGCDDTLIQPLLAMGSGVTVMSPENVKADFIVQDQTAVIYNPEDAEDISSRLGMLLDDTNIARQFATRALEYLSQYHRTSQMINETLEAYQKTLGQKE